MGKFLATIYGISTYLLFLVTALYMIGFLGNFAVPKSISSGVETSFSKGILINLLLLSVFAIQHSLMARQSFKKWLTSFMNPAVERSTIYWLIMGIFALGWVVVFASTFMINHFELTGLQQVYNYWKDKQVKPATFKTNYLYKFVRHPLMLGFLIVFCNDPLYLSFG